VFSPLGLIEVLFNGQPPDPMRDASGIRVFLRKLRGGNCWRVHCFGRTTQALTVRYGAVGLAQTKQREAGWPPFINET
jgi:hypothetical protein